MHGENIPDAEKVLADVRPGNPSLHHGRQVAAAAEQEQCAPGWTGFGHAVPLL
jgi:hypothetical protein